MSEYDVLMFVVEHSERVIEAAETGAGIEMGRQAMRTVLNTSATV